MYPIHQKNNYGEERRTSRRGRAIEYIPPRRSVWEEGSDPGNNPSNHSLVGQEVSSTCRVEGCKQRGADECVRSLGRVVSLFTSLMQYLRSPGLASRWIVCV